MKKDYAKTTHMDAWLRHPVLGDPSFDSFERLGDTVHKSQPPYEWAVNGSLFCDFDGNWYYYAGLYGYGYRGSLRSRFKIYRSADKGMSWEDLGWGFEEGFVFDGHETPADGCPDVVLYWDETYKKYLLTYDCSTNDFTWETAHSPEGHKMDSGAAIAWADSPAGPFTRVPEMFLSNRTHHGVLGRFSRFYASCVVPRKNDYAAFCLCDSNQHFAWGLAVLTAPTPEGPWSAPHLVLSCDRPEYYPCPVEFFPVEVQGDKVLAHATSVAKNRNYQAIFTADLESAHDPAAWTLTDDGNVWHSRDHEDEYFGIWGQTIHGFVEQETGRYIVMFPSKDENDHGTLNLAWRPFDTPHTDGFTLTGHEGFSVSPLLAAYDNFELNAEFTTKGCVDIAFDYRGILGPDDSCADSSPAMTALTNYTAVRICENEGCIVSVSPQGYADPMAEAQTAEYITRLRIKKYAGKVNIHINDVLLCENQEVKSGAPAPLALIVMPRSRIDCTRFEITGTPEPYIHLWNAVDALLGAGQLMPDEDDVEMTDAIAPDRWHRIPGGYIGEGNINAKWNLRGSAFSVQLQKGPGFGKAGIWVDGMLYGSIDLDGDGLAEYRIENLTFGRRAIHVRPLNGRIGIRGCVTFGPAVS